MEEEQQRPRKITVHEKIQLIACNIRETNALSKMQGLAKQWKHDKVDVAVISETQKNTGGMESGGPWSKYACFLS